MIKNGIKNKNKESVCFNMQLTIKKKKKKTKQRLYSNRKKTIPIIVPEMA